MQPDGVVVTARLEDVVAGRLDEDVTAVLVDVKLEEGVLELDDETIAPDGHRWIASTVALNRAVP